jgi:hypothetical protein
MLLRNGHGKIFENLPETGIAFRKTFLYNVQAAVEVCPFSGASKAGKNH